ncbi:MAG TPA: glycyl-radical enzyme activating protein [Erysipelotrichaceae bacterium]|nr:glycyl-radical enzyme activating protein [Erysipelotrichaceae bacterium]
MPMKNMKVRVFSIEEFSVYDGPGIRTTVFLKGCPLRCNWCHSPEGQDFKNYTLRSPNGCLECGACFDVCPTRRENCVACGKCIDVCPRNLIRFAAIDYEPQQLVDILLKNKDILSFNNGGITFSGGEPLAQYEGLKETVSLLKNKIHLALQTSGYAPREHFKEIVNQMDLVLFDMKIMDKEKAKEYEGINNELILENLKYLGTTDIPFIVRIPLIPGVVDTEENINAIISKIKDYSNLRMVELLPYNKYAGAKYKMAGKEYKPKFDESVPSNPRLGLFKEANISARVL